MEMLSPQRPSPPFPGPSRLSAPSAVALFCSMFVAHVVLARRAEVKEQAKAKKLSKRNGDIIQDAVVLWEVLRSKETSTAEKVELVAKILIKVWPAQPI